MGRQYRTQTEELDLEDARVEGRGEGRVEGQAEAFRESLELVLRTRFGMEADALVARAASVADLGRLRRAIQAAAGGAGLPDVAALLD